MQQQSQQQTSRADRIFEREEIIHKASMMDSDFRVTLSAIIDEELLSRRCKLALISIINMAFDKNAVLANNPDIELRVLRFSEAMNKAKLSYTRPDVMNPAIVYIHETIIQHFRDFVSRSYNEGERIKQGEQRVVSESSVSQQVLPAPAQEQRRGFAVNPLEMLKEH